MSRVTIKIDNREISAARGEKLLWVALDNGIFIPNLCASRDAERPAAACRLCFVEVTGLPHPVTACTIPVTDGMEIQTRSSRVDRLVRTGFELLLSNHNLHCGRCPKNKRCELQRIAKERGLKLKVSRFHRLQTEEIPVDDSLDNIIYDPSRCVLCGRCVEIDHCRVKVGAIGLIRRGIRRKVAPFFDGKWADSPCTGCGECVKACPVGALSFKDDWPRPKAENK